MNNIHILYGNGENCTCNDCVVLYGGNCGTTPVNNLLDNMELEVLSFLRSTPTGRVRVNSEPYTDKVIESVIYPILRTNSVGILTMTNFNKQYYIWLPFVYLLTTERIKGRQYRTWRGQFFQELLKRADIKIKQQDIYD